MAAIFTQTELASFFDNMGMMIQSGISVAEAMSVLSENADNTPVRHSDVISAMSGRLSSGDSFSDAMRKTGSFPEYAIDMISTSEYTGRLEDSCFHLSSYYTDENKMSSTLISAVRYPAALLVMVIAILLVLIFMVFPTFYGVYDNLTGSLGASAYNYINISFLISRLMLVISAVMLVVLSVSAYSWNHGRRKSVRAFLSHFKSMRKLFECMDLYRFTSCFEMFITAGENRDESLARSMSVTETQVIRDKLERCSSLMAEGKSFSQAATDIGLYDATNNKLLIPAERSGMLDEVMERISVNLRNETEERVSMISNTAEPLLTGFLIIFIGIILISIMMPLIGIMNSMG